MRAALLVLAVLAALGALGALGLSAYTSHKLDRGRMVRGEMAGATFARATIVRKEHVEGGRSERDGRRFPDQCMLELEVPGRARPVKDWADEPVCATRWARGPRSTWPRSPTTTRCT